jgi:CubicO group peptidase (beta-lactamase class C family)
MSDHKPNTKIVAALDALFERWNRADQPGLVVGVQYRDRPLYRRAFGMASLETGQANHVATAMRIGSTSKHFLGLLLLLLEEEGLVDLDASIGGYIPELQGHGAEPTLRQLLQHRGGSRCHIDMGFIGHGLFAPPEGSALELLRRQNGRNFPPGTASIYNNGGYHLASLAASRRTGAPLAELFKRYLFEPLKMHDTQLVPSDYVMTTGIASLHLPGAGQWRRGLFPSREVLGEGGIVSTVDDMLKWAAHLQSRNVFGGQRSWDALLDTPAEIDGSPSYYGLGLMQRTYRGVETIRHSGGVIGGSSDLVCVLGEDLDVIIMSNGAPNAAPSALADQIVDIVLGATLNVPPPNHDPAEYSDWLGHYGSPETGMLYSLENHGGTLCLRVANYAVPFPLALDKDGGRSTGLTGNGTVRVHREPGSDGMRSLRIKFAGQNDVCTRQIIDADAGVSEAVEGAFESPESGFEARIEHSGKHATLRVRDKWGSSEFDLSPLGGPWLSMRSSPHSDQFGATLFFPNGWQGDFTLNSARTRNLEFRRLAVGKER